MICRAEPTQRTCQMVSKIIDFLTNLAYKLSFTIFNIVGKSWRTISK